MRSLVIIKIYSFYARGMTTRDIAATFKKMYGAEVPPLVTLQKMNLDLLWID